MIAKTPRNFTMEDVLYQVYTEPSLFSTIKKVLCYSLRWLSKTFNEGNCESFFNTLKETDDAGRPLDNHKVENLCFIKCNGLNPLSAKPLIRGALNRHFPKAWHFISISESHFFISAAVSKQLKAAKEEFSLFY